MAANDAAGVLEGEVVVIAPLDNNFDPAGGGLILAATMQPEYGAAVLFSPLDLPLDATCCITFSFARSDWRFCYEHTTRIG